MVGVLRLVGGLAVALGLIAALLRIATPMDAALVAAVGIVVGVVLLGAGSLLEAVQEAERHQRAIADFLFQARWRREDPTQD